MNIISNSQLTAWFKGMGSAGIIMNNVITSVMPYIIGALAVLFIYLISKSGVALGKAEGPEQRKEAKVKLFWISIAMLVTVVGPTIFLIFMNTIGKTTQATSGQGKPAPIGLNLPVTSFAMKIPYTIFV